MHEPLTDLSKARILVTNDDGIHAHGLSVLESIAKSLSEDVWVVAPEVEQSATSHSLTMRRPLRVRHLGERRYSVDGTPTDCVLVALRSVMKDERAPDLVLSGVNQGGNLGEDVTYSGTVAAAMEGALLGMRSIALSMVTGPERDFIWETAEEHGPGVIRRLASVEWPKEILVNVNFPNVEPGAVEGVHVCAQGRRQKDTEVVEGEDPGGRPYVWIGTYQSQEPRQEETDLAAIRDGYISVTPLHLDLTYRPLMEALEETLK